MRANPVASARAGTLPPVPSGIVDARYTHAILRAARAQAPEDGWADLVFEVRGLMSYEGRIKRHAPDWVLWTATGGGTKGKFRLPRRYGAAEVAAAFTEHTQSPWKPTAESEPGLAQRAAGALAQTPSPAPAATLDCGDILEQIQHALLALKNGVVSTDGRQLTAEVGSLASPQPLTQRPSATAAPSSWSTLTAIRSRGTTDRTCLSGMQCGASWPRWTARRPRIGARAAFPASVASPWPDPTRRRRRYPGARWPRSGRSAPSFLPPRN